MAFLSGFERIVRQHEPMKQHTWLKVGGPAEYLAEPESIEQLQSLVRRCLENDVDVHVLGDGSNLLVRDEGVSGMVVRLSHAAFRETTVEKTKLRAGGGAPLGTVVSHAVREGLAGLETLVGIPGTLGGALHGNAGSHGGDIGQWTCRATVMTRTGDVLQREREDLVFAYRQSSLNELVIVSGEFELERDDPQQLTKRMQKQWIVKKASQPMSHQPAGCIFKNVRGMSAESLVEQAGLKGARVGGAEVSADHPNFIVTDQHASSSDVLQLIDQIRQRVTERLGMQLELGLEIW